MIARLGNELDTRKQALMRQGMKKLRRLLESQVERVNVALADRKQAFTEHTKDLKKEITDHSTRMAQATSFQ